MILSRMASLFLLLFTWSCSVEQPKFDLTAVSTRSALAQGNIKGALVFFESAALTAEKRAAVSQFPKQDWETAAGFYRQASQAARFSGHLQKALSYGEKALEMAELSQNLVSQVNAVSKLAGVYNKLRNFDGAVQLIEKGLRILEETRLTDASRMVWQSNFYAKLGANFSRKTEYEKAVDAFSKAVHRRESALALHLARRNQNPNIIDSHDLFF